MLTKKESGQIIVIIAFSIIALVIFSALVIDGGMIYLSRREMQTAADSAAIAAASVYCEVKNPNAITMINAIQAGEEYASLNGADESDVHQMYGTRFYASATKNVNTFFAGLFGQDHVDVFAEAAADCGPAVVGTNLMPIAFACKDATGNIISSDPLYDPSADFACQIYSLEKSELNELIAQYGPSVVIEGSLDYEDLMGQLFVIMDSIEASEEFCEAFFNDGSNEDNPFAGYFDCDFSDDDDPDPDKIPSAGRSWMDLDGPPANAAELVVWLEDGYLEALSNHIWLQFVEGNKSAAYTAANDLEGKIVVLPVFDIFCYEYPCVLEKMHDFDDTDRIVDSNNSIYFHIITFVEFYVTCVDVPGQNVCPGALEIKKIAAEYGFNISTSFPAIEGFILKGSSDQVGGDPNSSGTSAGAYSIYLVPTE